MLVINKKDETGAVFISVLKILRKKTGVYKITRAI